MSELNAISIADGVWRPIIPLSNHQPAGNASALAAGRYAVHRECGARLATLRFVLTGSGVTETSGTGAFSRAKASRGGMTGASATTGAVCGTMMGALVSKTIRSGHLRSDVPSADAATTGAVEDSGAMAQDGTRGTPDSPQSLRDRHFSGYDR
jgi:hypothetical protein